MLGIVSLSLLYYEVPGCDEGCIDGWEDGCIDGRDEGCRLGRRGRDFVIAYDVYYHTVLISW